MPRRQPFTALCRQAAAIARPPLADLHTHTTASDGDFTASQVVAFAVQAGLKAVAITDHDTMAGVPEAEAAVRENRYALEVVPGVELSTVAGDRDYHLLAYDVRPVGEFAAMLQALQHARQRRFDHFLELLEGQGVRFDADVRARHSTVTGVGRRHLARLLVQAGASGSLHDAFRRFLLPLASRVQRLAVVPLADAIAHTHAVGGFAVLAHPPSDFGIDDLRRLRAVGLDGVEVVFPAAGSSRTLQLREWTEEIGLGCTGGSDCHGADRRVGSKTIPTHDLVRLRQSATSFACARAADGTPSVKLHG